METDPLFPLGNDERFQEPIPLEKDDQGGMSRVWMVIDSLSKAPFAVKFPQLGPSKDRALLLTLFHNEVAAYERVNHPNIVRLGKYDLDHDPPWYTTHWIDGEPLSKWLSRCLPRNPTARGLRRSDLSQFTRWIHTVADAMIHAHHHGVIHRDLSPRNILLEHHRDDLEKEEEFRRIVRLVVIDFGLTQLGFRHDPLSGGLRAGTPGYTAPEIEAGATGGPVADVYSLGAILFHGAVGFRLRPVLVEADHRALIEQSLKTARISRDLAAVIRHSLAYDPNQRYSMEAFAQDLKLIHAGEIPQVRLRRQPGPGKSDPASLVERIASYCRRNGRVLTVAGLLLMAVLGVLANLWYRYQAQRRDAHTLRVATAGFLAREGHYPEALPYLDAALSDGFAEDRREVERLRLRVLYGLNLRPRFDRELKRLEVASSDAPDPTVRFIQADFLLSDFDRQAEGQRLLHAVEDQLPDLADQEYVKGLLTPDTITARGHWEKALGFDHFHHLSHRALVFNLVLSGEFAAAERNLQTARSLFRWDSAWDAADAVIALCRRDRPALERYTESLIETARSQGIQETAVALREALLTLDDTLKHLDDLSVPTGDEPSVPRLSQQQIHELLAKAKRFDRINRNSLTTLGFRVSSIAPLLETIPRLNKALLLFSSLKYEAGAEELEAASTKQPDALLAYSAGVCRMLAGTSSYVKAAVISKFLSRTPKTPEKTLRQLRLARDQLRRALDLPTLLPTLDYRYSARCYVVLVEAALIAEEHDTDRTRRSRLEELIQSLVPQGRAFPQERDRILGRVAMGLESSDPGTGRWVLQAWHRDQPDSPIPLVNLAQIELRAGERAAASRHASDVLAMPITGPDDHRMQAFHDQMRAVVQQAKKAPPGVPAAPAGSALAEPN